jgi:hypothetical protein
VLSLGEFHQIDGFAGLGFFLNLKE